MAGQLTIDTLKASSGVLATQNGMTGIAKAWVNFNGTGTVAIRDSFNVSSITDNGTGDYTVNFTTAMPNANYVATVNCSDNVTGGSADRIAASIRTQTTSSVRISSQGVGAATYYDSIYCGVSVFSA